MDEDRERGRIASTATKRKAAVEHAKLILPHVRAAIAEARRTDRGDSLRAIATWLNDRDHKTLKGRNFRAQTVSRLLYQTEDYIRTAAEFEYGQEVAILRFNTKNDGSPVDRSQIARLQVERDRTIAEGVALGKSLRLEDDEA